MLSQSLVGSPIPVRAFGLSVGVELGWDAILLIAVGVGLAIVFWRLWRSGARLLAQRAEVLDRFATLHGLRTQPKTSPKVTASYAGTVDGLPFELCIARRSMPGGGSREIVSFRLRPAQAMLRLLMRERAFAERSAEIFPGLLRVVSGNEAVDARCVSYAEREDGLRALLDGPRLEKIAALCLPIGGLLQLEAGTELLLEIDITLDASFYRPERLEACLALLREISRAAAPR